MKGTVGDDNKPSSVEEEFCSQVAQGFRTHIKEIQSENRSPEIYLVSNPTMEHGAVLNIADCIQRSSPF
ncbi:hypothetical protein SLEP1_g16424 [Rubroshorea leprosula]|uniref:Uncharacterized protein n=1 Tax=Rubroshorea leprosula TaxID=152421 RepID=A0AAV5J1F4_9ROSI|nr:hypothetical protein SLEP1_g16424 [Rubroshorea leprosula]